MKDTISLQRIKLLLRADWMKHRSYVYYAGGALVVIAVLLLYLATKEGSSNFMRHQKISYWISFLCYFIYYCRYVGMKVHTEKGITLALPANTLEKFITLLLEGVMLLAGVQAGLLIISWLIQLLIPDYSILNIMGMWSNSRGLPAIIVFICSLNFLSYVTFRKYPGLAMALGVVFMFAGIGLLVKYILYVTTGSGNNFDPTFIEMTNLHYTLDFLLNYYHVMVSIASLVVFYIAYLKLKEKELR